jgi:hypothetical protein
MLSSSHRKGSEMAQRKPLSPKKAKVVKAKVEAELKGLPQQVAAEAAFPNQTPGAAAVSMSRALKDANVQEALAEAFAKYGIDIDTAVKPIGDALKAERVVIVGKGDDAFADVQPDHAIRLKASGMALNLMGIGKQTGDVTINFIGHAAAQREIYDL